MNKNCVKNTKYAINWDTHPQNFVKSVCSLMEHQSLVDIVISCGNNTIQAHKFILASNSPLFREEFEKNPSIEQILISGCDFSVLKSVVEIMYCGQTVVTEENVKFLIAMVKLFQLKNLENLFNDHSGSAEEIHLPKPQFLTKKPKYPSFSYQTPPPISQNGSITTKVSVSENDNLRTESCQATVSTIAAHQNGSNVFKPVNFNVTIPELIPCGYKSFRGKKTLKQQAEQACVKEAQASRLALASLQKEIAVAPQVNNFIIEETFAETTVENFIPNQDQPYMEVLNYDEALNRNRVDKTMFMPSLSGDDAVTTSSQYSNSIDEDKKSLSNEKLKMLLGPEISSNVEIMYKDAQGNFVPINDEVLHNLATKEGIQYQIVDEDGHVSELQELHVLDKLINNIPEDTTSIDDIIEITKPSVEVGDYLKDTQSTLTVKDGICSLVNKSGNEVPIPQTIEFPVIHGEGQHKTTIKTDVEFSPDIFFADFVPGNVQNDISITGENLFPYENK